MRSLSTADKARVRVLEDTIRRFSSTDYTKVYSDNMERILQVPTIEMRRPIILCIKEDTLEAVMNCTSIFGRQFVALNMANDIRFGGGYLNGRAAQEENIFRRTNAHFSGKAYSPEMSSMIRGEQGVYPLNELICIKGKETDREGGGYRILDSKEIFSFIEMRAAAVDTSKFTGTRDQLREEMTRRIETQFKTLLDKGHRHAVLGAFGCGAFRNDPVMIANIYRSMLMKYEEHIDVVVFAIYYAGIGENNHQVFEECLRGLGESFRYVGSEEYQRLIT